MTEAREPGTEETDSTAEGAEDLDDAALAAAALGAEADVSTDSQPPYPEDEEEAEGTEATPTGVGALPAATRTPPAEEGPHLRPEERRARRAARTQIPIDPALRIKDPASAGFVVVVVAVFALIFLNGLVLGHGGILTPRPTAAPTQVAPTVGPSDTTAPSVGPSDTTAPSASPIPSTTVSPPPASPASS